MSEPAEQPAQPTLRRQLAGWAGFVLGIFAFETVAAQPFYIPSESMMPVLRTGDRLVVTKFPYGFSYASAPINLTGPVPGRLFGSLPERGDIVTVSRRGDGEVLIKRVIGLPGDTIRLVAGQLYLNGRVVPRERIADVRIPIDRNTRCDGILAQRRVEAGGRAWCSLPAYRETLPNGVRYTTIDLGARDLGDGYFSPGDDFEPMTVPEGHVFLMGDNRDQSADSRFTLEAGGLGGPVPLASLGGRAEFITHSFSGDGAWYNPLAYVTALRGDRFGASLRPDREPRR